MKNKISLENKSRVKSFENKKIRATVKAEASVLKGLRHYFDKNEFVEIVVPHITKATGACENIDTMFAINYFGKRAYLSQTGQLFLEVFSQFLGKVWCSIHSFRAEPSVDNRHLTEFTLVEIEFLGNLDQLIKHTEGAIYSAVKEVEKLDDELELLGVSKERLKIFRPPYKRITYSDAIKLLQNYFEIEWGDDLKSKHEKILAEIFGPVFITHYPKEIKFFNMKENEIDSRIVNSTDLILPISGEAVGGAEREIKHEKLLERLKNSTMLKLLIKRGGSINDFDWYLNFWREHEGKPHAGCGIGVSRVVQSILGFKDIRLTTPFPMNRENLY